jgi:uncharacterized protein involved in response to NO
MSATMLTPRWRFAWLYAAPHRLAFAAGASTLAVSAAWWALAMLAQSMGHPWRFALPPSEAHGLVMVCGFMPLFFTGFLFTAGPRWLGRPPASASDLAAPVLAQLSGWTVFLLGAHARDADLAAVLGGLGVAAAAFGWTQVWWRFVGMLRASVVADRTHARVIAFAGGIGALSLWAAAAGIAVADHGVVRAALSAALWLFVGSTYAAVAHRMIPFFSAAAVPVLDAWRPLWLLWSLVALFAAEGLLALGDAWAGPWPGSLQALQGGIEVVAGLALLALAVRWGVVQTLRIRLLAMLHLGFVWLGLSFVLAGTSHLLSSTTAGAVSLGLAPLHACTMGFLGSTLLAMATRVSCGHGGRTLTADAVLWRLFWLLQAAVVARVGAGILAANGTPGAVPLLAAAAVAWCAAWATWAWRHGRWYGMPRVDGRPG